MTINKINVNGQEYDIDVLINGSSISEALDNTATVALGGYRGKVFVGSTSTAAATAAKVVTVSDSLFSLAAGTMLLLTASATNTAASPTFNVNSSGAKSIKYDGAAIAAPNLDKAGVKDVPQLYVYDGSSWVWLGGGSVSASRLDNTAKIGDTNKPVYFTANGVPAAISYTIGTSVPTNAVFTDKSVTSAANHYAPTADSSSELTATLNGTAGAYALNTEYTVLTGVSAQRDAKGHVVGLTYTAQKVKDTNTTYSAGTASHLSDKNTSNRTWSGSVLADYVEGKIDAALTSVLKYKGTVGTDGDVTALPATHEVGDVYVVKTAGTYAGEAAEVGDYIICKTAGTAANDSHWDVINGENQVSNKSASLAGAGSSATIATVDGTDITVTTPSTWTGLSKTGTVTSITPGGGLINGTTGTSKSAITGSGTISLEASGVTAGTKGATANVTGTEGTTIKVPKITVDAYGRVTALAEYTLTNKNTTYSDATTSAAGLMSAADKTKLDNVTMSVSNNTLFLTTQATN